MGFLRRKRNPGYIDLGNDRNGVPPGTGDEGADLAFERVIDMYGDQAPAEVNAAIACLSARRKWATTPAATRSHSKRLTQKPRC